MTLDEFANHVEKIVEAFRENPTEEALEEAYNDVERMVFTLPEDNYVGNFVAWNILDDFTDHLASFIDNEEEAE